MAASLKQTIANRLNALKATGPKSDGGKARSARNALTHGLSRLGTTLPSEMADAIADRKERWRPSYRPEGPAQDWLFERLCAESVRLDSCERRLIAFRAEAADRAAESWDDDRLAEVATLASRLADAPEVVQPKLLQSRHGVLWMIDRWGDVASDLGRRDGWTPEVWFLALDLLGVPVEGRRHSGPWDLDPGDSTAGPGLELARNSVEALRARLEGYLDARDARNRADAEAGLAADRSPEIRLLERYASDARRQVSRCLAELQRLQALDDRPRTPAPAAPRAASAPPGPRPDRPSRSNPAASTPAPAPAAPEPEQAPEAPSPALDPAPKASPSLVRSPGLADSIRDRLRGGAVASPNRKARRALAASSRRS